MALYTAEMLAAAVSLSQHPLDREFTHQSEVRSRSCGSSLVLGFNTDSAGRITAIGVKPQACAVGQAAAAVFTAGAVGRDLAAVRAGRDALRDWLVTSDGEAPDWPMIGVIAPAKAHPGRHNAILLAWDAALAGFDTQHALGKRE